MSSYQSESFISSTKSRRVSVNNLKNHPFSYPYFKKGISTGIQAGAAMSLFLILLQAFNLLDNALAFRFFKYLILLGFLWVALSDAKRQLKEKFKFHRGVGLSAVIIAFSALTTVLVNTLFFFVIDGHPFSKFSFVSEDSFAFLVLSAVLFMEILVFGMIMAFIALQFLKKKNC